MSINYIPGHNPPDNAQHRREKHSRELCVRTAIKIMLLKQIINHIRDMRKQSIKSDDMNEEQLYYLQEGFREGLCASAMMIADEMDECYSEMLNGIFPEDSYLDKEEEWWHTHDDSDVGTDERL